MKDIKTLIDTMISEKEKAFHVIERKVEKAKQGNLSVQELLRLSTLAADLESARSAMMTLYELKGRCGI